MAFDYLIDSSAWVEYFAGSPEGLRAKPVIEGRPIATSIIAIAELADIFTRGKRSFVSPLSFIQGRAAILPVTVDVAIAGAQLKAQFRARGRDKFSLADGLHLATARQESAMLVTKDTDFDGEKDVVPIWK